MENEMMFLFALLLVGAALYIMIQYPYGFGTMEGFNGTSGPYAQYASETGGYENSHGSAPAGVHATPGKEQQEQNSASPPVNPANKQGNPQDTTDDLKKQPM
jgi:hypothetical protein